MLKMQQLHTVMARLSKREKTIFYCAVVFISLVMLDRLIVNPILHKILSLNEELKEKEAGIKKSLRILAHKDRIIAESAKYSSFLSSGKSEDEETTSMLREIESLADKTSIYLIDLKPRGIEAVDSSKRYFVNLNCEAQMEQLLDFMYNIESSDQLLAVDKYQLSPKSKESSVAKCKMTISKIVTP